MKKRRGSRRSLVPKDTKENKPPETPDAVTLRRGATAAKKEKAETEKLRDELDAARANQVPLVNKLRLG